MASGSIWLLIAVAVLIVGAMICLPLGMVRSSRNIARSDPSDNTHDDLHGTLSTQRGSTPPNNPLQ